MNPLACTISQALLLTSSRPRFKKHIRESRDPKAQKLAEAYFDEIVCDRRHVYTKAFIAKPEFSIPAAFSADGNGRRSPDQGTRSALPGGLSSLAFSLYRATSFAAKRWMRLMWNLKPHGNGRGDRRKIQKVFLAPLDSLHSTYNRNVVNHSFVIPHLLARRAF
jgi:hypothetical protein